jgi:hypothetical protein
MRQIQHLGIIAGMMALSSLESPESAAGRRRPARRSPEQNELAKAERSKKKQKRQNKKRNRK